MRALIQFNDLRSSPALLSVRGIQISIVYGIISVVMHQSAIPAEMLRFAKRVPDSPPELPLRVFEFKAIFEEGKVCLVEQATRSNDRLNLILYFMERWSIPVQIRE